MTVAVMFMGLVPVMWSIGAGADVMKRIAAPLIGGIVTSFVLELVVYPAVYEIWKWHLGLKRQIVWRSALEPFRQRWRRRSAPPLPTCRPTPGSGCSRQVGTPERRPEGLRHILSCQD